jgi:hypothetical protein
MLTFEITRNWMSRAATSHRCRRRPAWTRGRVFPPDRRKALRRSTDRRLRSMQASVPMIRPSASRACSSECARPPSGCKSSRCARRARPARSPWRCQRSRRPRVVIASREHEPRSRIPCLTHLDQPLDHTTHRASPDKPARTAHRHESPELICPAEQRRRTARDRPVPPGWR